MGHSCLDEARYADLLSNWQAGSADARSIAIGGSIIGGDGVGSGHLSASDITSLKIGGSLLGGRGNSSGVVEIGDADLVSIKGSIHGGGETEATGASPIGALRAYGSVKTLTLGGDVIAGSHGSGERAGYNGAILVSGNLGSATISGGIYGNPDQEAIILAKGLTPATPGNFQAIAKLTVRGSVSYGYIAAGHSPDVTSYDHRVGNAENADAGIGRVNVEDDWFHSNLTAGINDANTNGFSEADTRSAGDANRQATIGQVTIGGQIRDNPDLVESSGFGAERIASIIAGGGKLFASGNPTRSLDAASYVTVAEL